LLGRLARDKRLNKLFVTSISEMRALLAIQLKALNPANVFYMP
jgi:hypothetical protein